MATQISWQDGAPRAEDLYLVAIDAGTNSGYYTFSYWDGRSWSQSIKEKVVGFFPANQLLDQLVDQLDIIWPKPAHEALDDAIAPSVSAVDGEWQDAEEGQIVLTRRKVAGGIAPTRMAVFMGKNNEQPGLA